MAITLRRLFRNYISLIGGILAGLSFTVNVFLLFLDFLSPTQNPYVGIITYMILPGVTLTGLGLVFGGAAPAFLPASPRGRGGGAAQAGPGVTPGIATRCSARS